MILMLVLVNCNNPDSSLHFAVKDQFFLHFVVVSSQQKTAGAGEAGTGGNASVRVEVVWAGMMRSASVTQQRMTCQHIYEAFPKLLSALTHFLTAALLVSYKAFAVFLT